MRRNTKEAEASARLVGRRSVMLGGVMLGFMSVLAMRMRYMQVEQADEFRLLAEENRINIRLIPPSRGLIFDRNGVLIAGNEQNYRVVLVKEDAGNVEDVIARLQRLVALDPDELERAMREVGRRSPFVPVTIADRLSWEDMSEVAVNAPALPGITPEVGLSRSYPLGEDFAHIVGYVGPVSDYDLSKMNDPDPLLQIPKFQIGKVGVEARMEDQLRGKAGNRQIEVNAGGRVMRELARTEGTPGDDIQLTVDAALQNYVQARLAGESAAAVVMDCETGDLLAMGSAPSFDPNKFVRGISSADYKILTEDDHRPLANKTVQGIYPPGSTFKMVVALAALDSGIITAEDTEYCPGYKQLGNRRFHCWKGGGHGHVNLTMSLQQSCDVYYYEVAQKVGIERISAMARRLGLGQKHEIPMSAVAEGLIPTMDWKLATRGEPWQMGDTLNSAIGQGFILASPLQLSLMTARIATGLELKPRLVRSINGVEAPREAIAPLGLNENHLRIVRKGMYDVSNSQRGTAYGSRVAAEEFILAGKTGTSQVRNITAAERARGVTGNAQLPWNRRDHALFVCFAPYDRPKVACSVIVEHGGGGSAVAAPVARDIVLQALYGGTPPLTAYPANQRSTIEERQRTLPLRAPSPTETGRTRA